MARPAHEVALQAWVALALPATTVVYERQPEAPRPGRPFAALLVLNVQPVGEVDRTLTSTAFEDPPGTPTADFIGVNTWQYTGTVSVDIFADDHAEQALCLRESLDDPVMQEALLALGLTLLPPASMIDGTALAGTIFEGRTAVDFAFAFARQVQFRGQAVETFGATATILE